MGAARQTKSKASKKIKQDSFLKKEWRHVFIPGYFGNERDIGFTVAHKVARGKVPMDYFQNRTWELSHGDVAKEDKSHTYRLFKWRAIAASDTVYTQFAGMRLTRDKLGSLLRKYRTLVNAEVDVKTQDGFIIRMFAMGFTKKLNNSQKKHAYANQTETRKIREEMINSMREAASNNNVGQLCKDIVEEKIEASIIDKCKTYKQVEYLFITKIKVIKAPQLTAEQIKDLHIPKEAVELSQPLELARPTEQ